MPDRVVISDASTIIGLENIGCLYLLEKLYATIEITSIVAEEVALPLPDWLIVNDRYDPTVYRSFVPRLDAGEASSIALALTYDDSLLIIDERKGRREAKSVGLKITGVTGIIIRAKNEAYLESGKAKLDQLIEIGFRLSTKIYDMALEAMGEN